MYWLHRNLASSSPFGHSSGAPKCMHLLWHTQSRLLESGGTVFHRSCPRLEDSWRFLGYVMFEKQSTHLHYRFLLVVRPLRFCSSSVAGDAETQVGWVGHWRLGMRLWYWVEKPSEKAKQGMNDYLSVAHGVYNGYTLFIFVLSFLTRRRDRLMYCWKHQAFVV